MRVWWMGEKHANNPHDPPASKTPTTSRNIIFTYVLMTQDTILYFRGT